MAGRQSLVERIWDSLGTFWGQFPDKDLLTELWEGYSEVMDEILKRKSRVHLSRFLKTLKPVLDYNDSSLRVITSGDDKNTITISGLHAASVNEYVFSIPTLSGIETGQILTEGVDYVIYEKKYIQFLSAPEYDSRNTAIENAVTLYADNTYRHNPVLWELHASGISLPISSLDNEDYLPYNTIEASGISRVQSIAEHYKYFIWALGEMKRRAPTIKNIKAGYEISRGLAFTYRAGTVQSIIDDTVTVAVSGLTGITDSYDIPPAYTLTVTSGQVVPQFTVMISGVRFYDSVNNYDYMLAQPGVNFLNYASQVRFEYDSNLNLLNYNSSYHDSYVSSLMPASLTYDSIEV